MKDAVLSFGVLFAVVALGLLWILGPLAGTFVMLLERLP